MTEVRTRAEQAQSSVSLTTVSIYSPADVMFVSASQFEQRLPIDALNSTVSHARGILHCAYSLLAEEDASRCALDALFAVIDLLDQVDKLHDFVWKIECSRRDSASCEGSSNHA